MDSVLHLLALILLWFANGVLATAYWLLAHIPEMVCLAAGMWMLRLDDVLQERASSRPRRYGRGQVQTAPRNARRMTWVTLGIWLAVSVWARFPIPLIGAGMWLVALAGILLVSEERVNQQWWAKTGILVYAALVLLLQAGLGMLNHVQAAEWASVVGTSGDAESVLDYTRSSVATLGMAFVLVLYPAGYAAMLFNRFIRNPKPLYNVFAETGDVLRRMRTRD